MDFIKDIHEARMTKTDGGSAKKLTYTDCCERAYLLILAIEAMRNYSEYSDNIRRYCKKTSGFDTFRFYRIMGTDLYNFLYFIAGDESAQDKLKDPEAAKRMARTIKAPVSQINRYITSLANGSSPSNVGKMLIDMEQAFKIVNTDYKYVRRGLANYNKLTRQEKRVIITRLIYAVRAKLRSSDIIDDFEKFAAIKNLEKTNVSDPEPTISTPDISTDPASIALYRYIVGAENLAQTKRFLDFAKNGQSVSASMLQSYLPAIKMLDDIVQAGPAYVQNLRALHKRAKK